MAREVNDRIRNFARLYTPRSKTSTVNSVQVLDVAELSRLYIETNAEILDIPLDETYELRVESRWESLVAQLCASLHFAEDPRGCLPGMVSVRFVCTYFFLLVILPRGQKKCMLISFFYKNNSIARRNASMS